MLCVGAFAVLGAGAVCAVPLSRGAARPTGVCDQGRGTGWITQEPVRPHGLPRETAAWLSAPKRAWSSGVARTAGSEERDNAWNWAAKP